MRIGILGYTTPLALDSALQERADGTIDELWCFNPPSVPYYQAALDNAFDRWFEFHPVQAHLDRLRDWYPEFLGRLVTETDTRVEVNYREKYGDVAGVNERHDDWTEYPFHEFPARWIASLPPRKYQASSLDWLIRYAIHLGSTEIVLFGQNMQSDYEPDSGRACVEYWLGYAEGRGITIRLVDCWALLTNYEREDDYGPTEDNPLYAYDRLARQSGKGRLREWWQDLRAMRESGLGSAFYATRALDKLEALEAPTDGLDVDWPVVNAGATE